MCIRDRYQRRVHGDETVWDSAKKLLSTIKNTPPQHSVKLKEDVFFHYLKSNGIALLTVCDGKYKREIAFTYLHEVAETFLEEIKKTYGTDSVDYRSRIETIDKPLFFKKFEVELRKKRDQYEDQEKASVLQKVNKELVEVTKILTEDFELMMDRDRTFSKMGERASTLKKQSSSFHIQARKAKWQLLLRKYYMFGILLLIILGGCFTYFFLLQFIPVSYTHLRAHETSLHLVCRLLLEKKKKKQKEKPIY
eukprot:TRINITY_DN49714_c0_g1_i2.p1 TRINITY_DN49714_c0_g1~~TRINITY_DN49714_c0_g1_i2.p1  ORF type:complete len:251 (-),score=57.17 TRINITY_DN49714_c0_g1_i2:114-866(-)